MKKLKKRISAMTPTIKLLIIVAFLAVATVSYFVFIYNPTSERMDAQEIEIEDIENAIASEKQKETKMVEMQEQLKDPAFTKQTTPEYDNISEVMRYLSEYSASVDNWQFKGLENTTQVSDKVNVYQRRVDLIFTVPSHQAAIDAIDRLYQCPYTTVIANVVIEDVTKSTDKKVSLTIGFFENGKTETATK
jgi:hypothetical protein